MENKKGFTVWGNKIESKKSIIGDIYAKNIIKNLQDKINNIKLKPSINKDFLKNKNKIKEQ